MTPCVFIDPHMYHLVNEDEVEQNLDFYKRIMDLCENDLLQICTYQELFKSEGCVPFPIRIQNLGNPDIRKVASYLNSAFMQIIANHGKMIDIDSCDGDSQEQHQIDGFPLESKEDEYTNLFWYMLSKCYQAGETFESSVLTGRIANGVPFGTTVVLKCTCSAHGPYRDDIRFVGPEEYENRRSMIEEQLNDLLGDGHLYCAAPHVIKDGDHHQRLQSNDITSYSSLSPRNRSVLAELRYFGLHEVHFGEYNHHSWKRPGSIRLQSCEASGGNTVICGLLCGEIDNAEAVRLIFPGSVGQLLFDYFSECGCREVDNAAIMTLRKRVIN